MIVLDGADMSALLPQIGRLLLLGYLWRQPALLADGDLVLATDLRIALLLDLTDGEAAAVLALFEICDGILAKGNVLGEEVVEIIGDERVVDTASVAEGGQDEERGQEASETAWFPFRWWRCR